jgi:hypothetical protein
MPKKKYLEDDHPYFLIFEDVKNHETAAIIYLAEVIMNVAEMFMEAKNVKMQPRPLNKI